MNWRLDDLDGHLEVLVRLRRVSGADVYDRALLAARVAVAKVILAEAHRLAARRRLVADENVVPFRKTSADEWGPRDREP